MTMPDLSLLHVARPAALGANTDDARPPLLILLHGVGSNEQSMAALAPAFDERFIVLSVRSPIVLRPGSFAWFHVTFGSQGPVINAAEAEAGWSMLAQFIDEAVAAYDADPERVFVAGFSQGGIMSLAAMLTTPERVAGAVSMSGRLLPEVLPNAVAHGRLAAKPALIVHGTRDDKLGIQFARSARETLETLGLDLTYRELPMGHQVTRESLDEVVSWLASRLDARVTT
jgi:phospholipase/carboxylesterase